MRTAAPNASPGMAREGRRTPLLHQIVVAFVLVLMGGLGAALLLAAAMLAGYE
jgi:hypothetical protein